MKTLFITGSLNQGGAEFQILLLANLFKDKGNEVKLLALTDYTFFEDFVKESGLEYSCLPNTDGKLKRVFKTVRYIKDFQPDLIISYLRLPGQIALFSKWMAFSSAKILIGERTSLVIPRYDKYYLNLLRFGDVLTVNSLSKKRYVEENFSFLQPKTFFLPNVVDVQQFSFGEEPATGKTMKVVYVGRIAREKNVDNLVKAFKKVLSDGHDAVLELYGDTRDESYLKKVKEEIGSENRIQLIGKTDQVNKVYESADLLCLLSDYEGFSNVLSEALCHGVPVVTSNIEENEFLIAHVENGYLVDPRDADSVAEGISWFLNLSIDEQRNIRINNRKKAEKIFDRDALYQEYCKILNVR